jgi:hypothetical protein
MQLSAKLRRIKIPAPAPGRAIHRVFFCTRQFCSFGPRPLSGTFESRARKNGALNKDPLWRRSGAISPFQVEKIEWRTL